MQVRLLAGNAAFRRGDAGCVRTGPCRGSVSSEPTYRGHQSLWREGASLAHSREVASRNGEAKLELQYRRPTSTLNCKVKALFPGKCRGARVLSWALRPRRPTNQRFDGLRLPNLATVGARLMSFAQEWDAMTTDLYVRSIVSASGNNDPTGQESDRENSTLSDADVILNVDRIRDTYTTDLVLSFNAHVLVPQQLNPASSNVRNFGHCY